MNNLAQERLKSLESNLVINNPERLKLVKRPVEKIHAKEKRFKTFCLIVATSSIGILILFISSILIQGVGTLTTNFIFSPPGPNPAEAGLYPAIMGTIYLLILTAIFTLPLGIAVAIIIEEFAPRGRILRSLHSFVQINISNLAGVPSVVYGIVGLTVFASMFQLFGNELRPAFEFGVKYYDQFYNESDAVLLVPVESGIIPETIPAEGLIALNENGKNVTINLIGNSDPWPEDKALGAITLRVSDLPGRISEEQWYYFRLPFGRSLITGALTLMLVILPIVIISAQEALRAVPSSLRDAALGLGSTKWQTVRNVTLPAAIPGIMTGAILAMSRAIGEAAPLLMIMGIVFITSAPQHIFDDFTAMPLQIYNWAGRPQEDFHKIAASGIIVLLGVLLCFNALAVWVRNRYQKPLS